MGRVLIYSDVHGNLPAFDAVLRNCGACEKHICLGDLVNYGPWGDECVEKAFALENPVVLMGNHEEAYINGHYPGSNELVRAFFAVTFPSFKRMDLIERCIPECQVGRYTLTHTISNKYIYPDSEVVLERDVIIGHSHHQFLLRSEGFELYNAGSVGQNRSRIDIANYLIVSSEGDSVEMRSVRYEIGELIERMRCLGYPEKCIDYYLAKLSLSK